MNESRTLINNWSNSLQLSGVIAKQPQFKTITKNNGVQVQSATFILAQPTNTTGIDYTKSILCFTYSKKVIEVLKSLERQSVVACLGMLASKGNNNYYPQITEIKLTDVLREKLVDNKRSKLNYVKSISHYG